MSHVSRIQKYEALSNGQIAVVIRVDADPASDYPLTLAVAVAADAAKRDAALTKAKAAAEALYQAKLDAEAAAINLVGQAI